MWKFIVVAIVFCQFKTEALIIPVPSRELQPPPFNLSAPQTFDFNYTEDCPDTMVRFTSDDNEIVCDCRIGQLYYEEDNQCYRPYTQGPCPEGQHLVYNEPENKVECVTNPCETEDYVPYNGSCYKLYEFGGPCDEYQALSIDENTFQVKCKVPYIRKVALITAPLKSCAAGSKRGLSGNCRKIISDK